MRGSAVAEIGGTVTRQRSLPSYTAEYTSKFAEPVVGHAIDLDSRVWCEEPDHAVEEPAVTVRVVAGHQIADGFSCKEIRDLKHGEIIPHSAGDVVESVEYWAHDVPITGW
jgi:hypothetical protein